MTEHMKDLAKRFFALLHLFLTRNYRYVDVVFIRHTDRAEEVDEQTFFYSRETGGPLVSSALDKMLQVVAERYRRSEEHTSELQSLMRISSAVLRLKKKK